jgi:hypothetical protein
VRGEQRRTRRVEYGYLRDREAGVGNGDRHTLDGLLRRIESLAQSKGHALEVDDARRRNLRDRQGSSRTR